MEKGVNLITDFWQHEQKNTALLGLEIAIILMTLIVVPLFCLKPLSESSSVIAFLIIPSLLVIHIACSAIWDARYGMTLPYFFTVSLCLFAISCTAQAINLSGPTFIVGYFIGEAWVGRLLCLLQVPIAYLVCVFLCIITGFLEEKWQRPLCGAGDIKCFITFFFFPLPFDVICQAVLCGMLLLLMISLIAWWKQGSRLPVRALPWMYLGTLPVLCYLY